MYAKGTLLRLGFFTYAPSLRDGLRHVGTVANSGHFSNL